MRHLSVFGLLSIVSDFRCYGLEILNSEIKSLSHELHLKGLCRIVNLKGLSTMTEIRGVHFDIETEN